MWPRPQTPPPGKGDGTCTPTACTSFCTQNLGTSYVSARNCKFMITSSSHFCLHTTNERRDKREKFVDKEQEKDLPWLLL